jgi:hypothetical protein
MTRALFALLALLAACTAQPTSRSYFAAHPNQARQVAAACRDGAQRGPECANAEAGEADAARDARMKQFKQGF